MNYLVEKFKKEYPEHTLVALLKVGSHFFNLNTKNSDVDYKGFYIPKNAKYSLSKAKIIDWSSNQKKKDREKNTKDDIDCQFFPLHKYFDNLLKGDFNSMEYLFAPSNCVIYSNELFEELRYLRKSLLVKNTASFTCFIRKEGEKYGVQSNYLKAKKEAYNFFKNQNQDITLKSIWDEVLELVANTDFIETSRTSTTSKGALNIPTLIIAKNKFHDSVRVSKVMESLSKSVHEAGNRKMKQLDEGGDFKGLSHALRLAYQAQDLVTKGEFKIPLSEEKRNTLLNVKTGQYSAAQVLKWIENECYKIDTLVSNNKYNSYKEVEHLLDKILLREYTRQELKTILSK